MIKLPVIDQHDRDGEVIGFAETAEEAQAMSRGHFLKGEPDDDEIAEFDARNAMYQYGQGTQSFEQISDKDLAHGYWAHP